MPFRRRHRQPETTAVRPRLRPRLIALGAAGAVLAALFILYRLMAGRPDLAERYARGPFFLVSAPLRRLSSSVSFSLGELVGALVLAYLVYRLVRFVRRRGSRGRRLAPSVLTLALVLAIALSFFLLLHGFNYLRRPLTDTLGLGRPAEPRQALEETLRWLVSEASRLRARLPDDGAALSGAAAGKSDLFAQAFSGYREADAFLASAGVDLPLARGYPVTAKRLAASRLFSYAGVAGIYNPFLAEANVNGDQPAFAQPFSALHELAHAQGFAREEDANFLAFLSGIFHPRPDYRYAALAVTSVYLGNRLAAADRAAFDEIIGAAAEAMRRDLSALSTYWRSFQGPVKTVSRNVVDTYLRANAQTEGIKSYGEMVDLVLGFYGRYGALKVAEGVTYGR